MRFNIITIFPKIFNALDDGVAAKSIKVDIYNLREKALNKHGQIDAKPYGGGEGMVLMPEPLKETLLRIPKKNKGKVIYLSPQGNKIDQKKVIELTKNNALTFICGRYEGIDQRFINKYVDEEISLGDFVLTGGELAAMCIIDAISRNLSGTLGNKNSLVNETFYKGMLKGPTYTRPEIFENENIPKVLLSGNHKKIQEWREEQSLIQTYKRRPDLLDKLELTKKQKKVLEELHSKDIL